MTKEAKLINKVLAVYRELKTVFPAVRFGIHTSEKGWEIWVYDPEFFRDSKEFDTYLDRLAEDLSKSQLSDIHFIPHGKDELL